MLKGHELVGEESNFDIKIPTPEEFDGSPDKLKPFLIQCKMMFTMRKGKFPTSKSRILYALSFFTKGKALAWRERVMEDEATFVRDVADKGLAETVDPWEAFKMMLEETFSTATAKTIAQQKLYSIRQGSRTVEEYITEFTILKSQSTLEDEVCELFFKNGLKDVIRQKIYESGTIPTDLKEWEDRAKAIDFGWRESQVFRGNNKEYGRSRFVKPGTNNPNRPKLSDEEFQKRRNDKLCFKCGLKGHFAKDCRVQVKRAQVSEEDKTEEQDFA
jgi:hypothetical protein